jgi:hypothetical protein
MKVVHRGCTDVYRRVKVVEEEVSLDEGFYTFLPTQSSEKSLIAEQATKNCRVEMEPKMMLAVRLESSNP